MKFFLRLPLVWIQIGASIVIAGNGMAQPSSINGASVIAFSHTATGDPIGDSFIDIYNDEQFVYLNQWPPELYVVILDFNSDGLSDLMMSANYFTNGKAGEMWHIFRQNDDGYHAAEMPIDFNALSTLVKYDVASKATSLLNLHSGGGGTASLVEIRLSDLGVENQVLRRYDWGNEEDVAHWKSLGDREEHISSSLKRLNFGPLMEKYADKIRGDIHDRTLYLDSSSKELPIDTRSPEFADTYVSLDEAYALLGKSASALSEARADDLLGKTVSTPIQSGALPDKLENSPPVEVDVRRQAVPEGTASEIQGLKSVEAQGVESESATGFPWWIAIFLGAVLIVGVSLWVRRIWNRAGRLVP